MSGWVITAILIALMAGACGGSCWRAWQQYQRDVAALDARAREHNARMDAQLAARLEELEKRTEEVKRQLKKKRYQKETR